MPSEETRIQEDRLFDEAVGFAVRLHADPWDEAALEALRLWRARSPAHEAAWTEVAEIHGLAGEALRPRGAQRSLTRRRALLGGLAGASAAAAYVWAPGLIDLARADHRTPTARIERLETPEGLRIALGPQSALRLEDSGARLLSGMAWCVVPPRSEQPFRLRIGAAELSSFGGAFCLSAEAGLISAAAESGEAEIRFGGGALIPLQAGERLSLGTEGGSPARGKSSPGAASAWLEGRLIVEAESLAVAAERLARWLPERVLLLDSALGARRVSGVFDLAEPRRALRTAVQAQGGRLRRVTPLVTLILRA